MPAAAAVVLPARLDIPGARALYEQLKAALAADGELLVDGSGVELATAAGAQVLVAFARSAKDRRRPVRWQLSSALDEAVSHLGLTAEFQN